MYELNEDYKTLWLKGEYLQFIQKLEESSQADSTQLTNVWYHGLAYLLQGEEETAQLIWLSALAEQEDQNPDEALSSLTQILNTEAQRLADLEKYREAWAIRHHLRELVPQDLNNLLKLIHLDLSLEEFSESSLQEFGIIDLLKSEQEIDVDVALVYTTFDQVIQHPSDESLAFAEACFPHFKSQNEWVEKIIHTAEVYANVRHQVHFAIALIKLCLKYAPENITALGYLPKFYTDCNSYEEALEAAHNFYNFSKTPEQLFFANCILLRALSRQGDWNEIPIVASRLKEIINNLIETQSTQLSSSLIRYLIIITGLYLYLKDDISENRKFQNQVSQLFQKNINANASSIVKSPSFSPDLPKKRLKVGYIASTLRNHSVGWLSRWLFQHHDHEKFEIYAYLVYQRQDNSFFANWFANQVDHVRFLPSDVTESVKIIREDELDILIDLDSITLDQTCTIMSFKPAPIQATWLGYDASGLPTIDYFIADPYVLPDDAQAHYQEKIWRLPSTYIAVTGFEVDVPTIHRSDLDIPEDAVIYWSSQAGLKRNPNIVRLQMKILQRVPNSYFLLKGLGDPSILNTFFSTIAEEEGVSTERLRFLPIADNEYIHRANLQIADVVLDTYPYNGATTTLETLWAGVPLVTRVGQQFSARNSYAFMMNVGVTEGIAWTDEEYIEWGVRFGQDETLRQQVSWKLKKSRHTSPLWKPKQFTLDMETAYRQMYSKFVESQVNH
ncbi:MAG: O-linked N-acetylglucosamine transferase, SPINDLY family protein [Thermosynechococcaceae cyanobacterium MS004]|nr:O-linked N-acetylglucosamine transferase, SPINDLY family protein [Thermosynechococcaceae cyanobacterium MS004]